MSDQIDIDWNAVPAYIARFIRRELKKCRVNGIKIILPQSNFVSSDDQFCAGFFDDNPPQLAVGVKGSYRRWLPVFVHETCHMDQWLENDPVWTRKVFRRCPIDLLDLWLNGKLELDKHLRREVIDCVLDIELDCEKRTVEKIVQNKLPIRLDTYIKKGNAYVWSYRIMQGTRSWKHAGVYSHPSIWRSMSGSFEEDYSRVPGEIKEAFRSALREPN